MIDLNDIKPGINFIEVMHDIDCPAIGTGVGCICQPEVGRVGQNTFIKNMTATRKMRRKAEREASKAIKRAERNG